MSRDSRSPDAPTRRKYLKYGGVVVGGGLLAGCTGSTDTESKSTATTTERTTESTETTTANEESSADGGSYSVSIEPVGEVTFESVPETWVANNGSWADMGIALGMEPPEGVWLPSRYHTKYYDEIPGVSVDGSSIQKLWGDSGVGKEQFYEIDADVHVADPNFLLNRGKWEQSDIEEISTQVGPFFGNSIFSRGYGWHDAYRYYTLYEAFEKVAQIHQEQERFSQLKTFHDEFLSDVTATLPGADQRPNALLTFAAGDEPEAFYPYRVSGQGANKKHFRDLGITDALAGTGIEGLSTSDRGQIDYEAMLEVDPDSILVRGHEGKSREEFEETVVSFMQSHETASELTAVQDGMVFRGGPIYSGPLHNLFLTERYATGYFPEQYSGELFDRDRLADIVTGEA